MRLKTRQIQKASSGTPGRPAQYLVERDGDVVGMLERWRNTRTETHPWKAYAGTGRAASFLGAFYEDGSVPAGGEVVFGGRGAALKAIEESVDSGWTLDPDG